MGQTNEEGLTMRKNKVKRMTVKETWIILNSPSGKYLVLKKTESEDEFMKALDEFRGEQKFCPTPCPPGASMGNILLKLMGFKREGSTVMPSPIMLD